MSKQDKLRALGSTAAAVAVLVEEEPPASPAPHVNGKRKPPTIERGGLVRIGVSLPQSVLDRIGDAQDAQRRAHRKVSISAFIEVAVLELLAQGPGSIREVIERYDAKSRRGGR